MTIKSNISTGVVGYNIMDVNPNEMGQMVELNNRINDVLASHAKDSKERKYVSDDDLRFMRAILSVFTKEYKGEITSAFTDFLMAEHEKEEEKKPKIPIGDDQLFG